jgi:hypothetical protein
LFVVELVRARKAQTHEGVTYQLNFEPLFEKNNPYLEIQINEQHPIEPYFKAGVFLNLEDKYGTEPRRFKLMRSAERNYGRSILLLDVHFDSEGGRLWMQNWADLDLPPKRGGLHSYFPFDSATFDFDLSLTPTPDLRVIRLTNRVPGFLMGCSSASASRNTDGTLNLKFQMSRNPLVQLTAITLAVTAAMFMILIVSLHKVETIAAAVASFFFSVWSVRGIFASQLRTFPTLLDCYILTLCAVLLVLLCWKVILSGMHKTEPALAPGDQKPSGTTRPAPRKQR